MNIWVQVERPVFEKQLLPALPGYSGVFYGRWSAVHAVYALRVTMCNSMPALVLGSPHEGRPQAGSLQWLTEVERRDVPRRC